MNMAKFGYVAKDMSGSLYKGVVDAIDKKEVRIILRQKGFYPTSIHSTRQWNKITLFNTITGDEVAIFAEQLSVMVDAGLTLVKCLQTLADQTKNEKFKQIINTIRQDVENGVSFADSLGNYPKVFSNLFINLVRTGEIGGVLSKSLKQVADYLDGERQIRKKVKASLLYPKIVFGLCVLVSIFLITFIVPRFMFLYKGMSIDMPLPTRIIIGISKFVPKYWWLLLGGGAGLYFGYMKFRATHTGKRTFDYLGLYAPIVGSLGRKVVVSRFIKVLGALTVSGVPIIQALDVAKEVANNSIMDEIIDKIRENVNAGGGLREPIADSKIFPPMVVQMVGLGEEVGSIGESLEKSSKFLDREVEDGVKSLMTKIEPLTTIIIGSIVGLILMAMYLPMFDVVKIVK
jgi:type IV pilus assembly protein PilC